MFADPKFGTPEPHMLAIMSVIGEINGRGDNPQAKRLSPGQYLVPHWNFENLCESKLEHYPVFPVWFNEPEDCTHCTPWKEGGLWFHADKCKQKELHAYGVCDSVEQFNKQFAVRLTGAERKFCVAFVEIVKAHESPTGGWRWHKWGAYVGDGNPQYEYLFDEPDFERVFTFHVYEILD